LINLASEFEGHHTVTEKLASTTTKMWVVHYISTAIILMLINFNLTDVVTMPVNFPILTGKYKDFTAEWYSNVGATICLT